jgi:purine nucleoside phosphorylase
VAVTDHVNLTWRSPLTGPNDDAVGPRFPSMTGIYDPETVVERLAAEGIIVVPAIVAGVSDDRHLSAFEAEMVGAEAYQAASSELVPVAIVAAHMGLRLAAVVVPAGS